MEVVPSSELCARNRFRTELGGLSVRELLDDVEIAFYIGVTLQRIYNEAYGCLTRTSTGYLSGRTYVPASHTPMALGLPISKACGSLVLSLFHFSPTSRCGNTHGWRECSKLSLPKLTTWNPSLLVECWSWRSYDECLRHGRPAMYGLLEILAYCARID
jgi:hypothetical protein